MKRRTRRRQRERPVTAHEERNTECLLQRLDLARQRGLGDEQLVGRACERQEAPGRLESLEEIEGRQRPQSFMHAPGSCVAFRLTV